MQDLLALKFQDPKLAKELLATKDAYLVEHNEKKVRGSLVGIGHVTCPQQYFDDLQKYQNELPVL